jgi:hypothetical protein
MPEKDAARLAKKFLRISTAPRTCSGGSDFGLGWVGLGWQEADFEDERMLFPLGVVFGKGRGLEGCKDSRSASPKDGALGEVDIGTSAGRARIASASVPSAAATYPSWWIVCALVQCGCARGTEIVPP